MSLTLQHLVVIWLDAVNASELARRQVLKCINIRALQHLIVQSGVSHELISYSKIRNVGGLAKKFHEFRTSGNLEFQNFGNPE